jgi:hypothetical protein
MNISAHCRVYQRASLVVLLLLTGCAGPASTPPVGSPQPPTEPAATHTAPPPSATPDPLPQLTLVAGEAFLRVDGEPRFIFSRNLAGFTPGGFEALADLAGLAGDVLVRVGTDNQAMGGSYGYGYTSDGKIREDWARNWEEFFEAAEANGVYVLPYFTGWFNWNTQGYNVWPQNPLNSANGGPADSPTEIFKPDSPTQDLYVNWFRSVVERWSTHRNIFAWELITEVNYINYITEPQGLYLVERLALAARAADPMHRPTTASLADVGEWPEFYRSDSVEFINFHPYPPSGKLDSYVLREVPRYTSTYGKPLLIGESGLNAAEPNTQTGRLTVAARARIGLQHAIWAELVSGAMNGRAFFWEDGYGVYFPELGMDWIVDRNDLEKPMAAFIGDVDVERFRPIPARAGTKLVGAALGNEQMIIGWYRDAACEPPDWPSTTVPAGQEVTLTVPGSATRWQVDFYDTKSGEATGASAQLFAKDGKLVVFLPEFTDDIAFKMYAR